MLQGVILACLVACIILQEKRFEELESEHSHLWNKVEDLTKNGLYSLHGWLTCVEPQFETHLTFSEHSLVLAIELVIDRRVCYSFRAQSFQFIFRCYGTPIRKTNKAT